MEGWAAVGSVVSLSTLLGNDTFNQDDEGAKAESGCDDTFHPKAFAATVGASLVTNDAAAPPHPTD